MKRTFLTVSLILLASACFAADITSVKERTVKIVDEDTAEITVVYVIKKSGLEADKSAIVNQELSDKDKRRIAKIDEQLKMFEK